MLRFLKFVFEIGSDGNLPQVNTILSITNKVLLTIFLKHDTLVTIPRGYSMGERQSIIGFNGWSTLVEKGAILLKGEREGCTFSRSTQRESSWVLPRVMKSTSTPAAFGIGVVPLRPNEAFPLAALVKLSKQL
jgi:hypothetical protein